jgi:hypothetical protein
MTFWSALCSYIIYSPNCYIRTFSPFSLPKAFREVWIFEPNNPNLGVITYSMSRITAIGYGVNFQNDLIFEQFKKTDT